MVLENILQALRKMSRPGILFLSMLLIVFIGLIDYLTSVANSRFFYELAEMEMERSKRHDRMFSLAYMDVDNFKKINDNWGHKTGDLLLQTIAEIINKADSLMYIAKKNGKNAIECKQYNQE
ncbi:MAG: GGDEF domain-containing protein [Candidatus Omnitrophica bacterium]|nr:GGDEF domain-containing protein [Candidatus Omnitrophota bacterium]